MKEFARTVGFMTLTAGAVMLVSPETARRLIQVRAEFARLSSGALRFLGGWYLLTGALLISTTVRPAAEVRAGEVISPELRKVA